MAVVLSLQIEIFILILVGLLSSTNSTADKFFASCSQPLGLEDYGIDNSQLYATSEVQNSTEREKYGSQSARLNNKFAWQASENATKGEYLQIDLGQLKTVTALAIQGHTTQSYWVTAFTVKHSLDNDTWGEVESFEGNTNKDDIRKHILARPLHTRYLQFVIDAWHNIISMRAELYGCTPTCDNQPIGISNYRIPDSQISASSTLRATSQPHNARLGFTLEDSWCAAKDDNNTYLQIDLGVVHVLCAIDTQGNSKADEMVTSFTLQTSLNGLNWTDYEENGKTKIFGGNYDRNYIVKRYFNTGVVGRFVRVVPLKFIGASCMRLEFYGVEKTSCDHVAVGLALPHSVIPDAHFTATSDLGSLYQPSKARLHDSYCWEPQTTYSSADYLQIDLGDPHLLCGIGTQETGQSFRIDERTLSYEMSYSLDGNTFTYFPEVLPGNVEKAFPLIKIAKNAFDKVYAAKFIRIYPKTFQKFKSIRAEVYGLRQVWRGAFGTQDIKNRPSVPNKLFNALYSHTGNLPWNARLYHSTSWCAKETSNAFLEVTFLQSVELAGLALQGSSSGSRITKYDLEYGNYVGGFAAIKDINSDLTNGDKVHVYWLEETVAAFSVRIRPNAWVTKPCARVEIYINRKAPMPRITTVNSVNDTSTVNLTCIATGDERTSLHWQIDGYDATNKADGQTYEKVLATTVLRLNLSSLTSPLSCEWIEGPRQKCVNAVTCLARSSGMTWDDKDYIIEQIIDQPVQIIVANVSGELKAEEGSNVIATCIAAGNNETDFKWIVNDLDITYLSSDSIYRGALVSSQLQLNFTEDSSVASDYVCKETEEFQWNCTRNITCQAIRGNITLDTKDIVITLTGVERQHEITSLDVISIIPSENKTHATIQCVSNGDSTVNIRWLLAERDVTDLSRGQNHSQTLTTSQLQVNFSMAVYDYSTCFYSCVNDALSTLRCTANVSCIAARPRFKQMSANLTMEALVGRIVYGRSSLLMAKSWVLLVIGLIVFVWKY